MQQWVPGSQALPHPKRGSLKSSKDSPRDTWSPGALLATGACWEPVACPGPPADQGPEHGWPTDGHLEALAQEEETG